MSSSPNYEAELASLMNGNLCSYSSPPFTEWLDWCDERRNDIVRALNKLYNRVKDLLEDPCFEYETFKKIPFDQEALPQDCQNRRKLKTWTGHQDSAKQTQRQVGRLRNGFNDRGCSDEDNEVNDTVDEWTNVDIDSLVPDRKAEEEGIEQDIPPKPDLYLLEGTYCAIMIHGICVMPTIFIS
jgi:hypothetical protein